MTTASDPVRVPADDGGLTALLRRSRYVDALDLVGGMAGLREAGADADDLARRARLAGHLGAWRLRAGLLRAGLRRRPGAPALVEGYGHVLLARRGPLHTLGWLGRQPPAPDEPGLVVLRAMCLAQLRDRAPALAHGRRAVELLPDLPWPRVALGIVHELLDESAEAETLYRETLAREPTYRVAALGLSAMLSRRDDRPGALAALDGAERPGQSIELSLTTAHAARLAGDLARADEALERARRFAVYGDPVVARGVHAIDYELGYACGDRERVDAALRALGESHDELRARIAAADAIPAEERLEVPFVAQKHMTCVPASLVSVARFHGHPVDHDAVVREVCFGGTPAGRQRAWAEQQGFEVRGFSATDDSVRAMIDAGVPVLLKTAGPSFAHMQVVRGYDPVRRVWLTMNPAVSTEVSIDIDRMLEHQTWHGPEASVAVPTGLIDAVPRPPDADAWALRDRMSSALEGGRTEPARAALAEIRANFADHIVRPLAEAEFGEIVGEPELAERAVGELRERYPDTPKLAMRQAGVLERLGRPPADREALLRPHAFGADPALLCAYGRLRLFDPAGTEEAGRAFRRAAQLDPKFSFPLGCLAEYHLHRREWEDCARLCRWALCLDPAYGWAATHYAIASRHLGRVEEALAFLEERVLEAGDKAREPVVTLLNAYTAVGRHADGLTRVESLAQARPEDGELALICASARLRRGDREAAARWLNAARRTADPASWAGADADLASARGDTTGAIARLEDALEQHPHRQDLRVRWLDLVSVARGAAAVAERGVRWVEERPDEVRLLVALVEHLVDEPARALVLLDRYLARHPIDSWAIRERAVVLSRLGRHDEGLAALDRLIARSPGDAVARRLRGRTHELRGDLAPAIEDYRAALALEPDDGYALRVLVATLSDPDEGRRAILDHVERLRTHGSLGPGIDDVLACAHRLSVEDGLAAATALRDTFDHLLPAHRCLLSVALGASRLDEAAAALEVAEARFPDELAVRRLGFEVALQQARHDDALARARHIVELVPMDDRAVVDVASALDALGRGEEAERELRNALERPAPWIAVRTALADRLRARGDAEGALDALLTRPQMLPPSVPLWHRARATAAEVGAVDRVTRALRARVEALPDSTTWWLLLGGIAPDLDEAARAYERALQIDPKNANAADGLATVWVERRDYERALACCPPDGWDGPVPVNLRGRRAWIRHARGEVAEARADMKALLAEDPSYSWGLDRLLEWAERANDLPAQVEALELSLRAYPDAPTALSQLGAARLALGQPGEAADAFREAARMTPSDPFPVSQAVAALLSAKRPDEARAFVNGLPASTPPGVRAESQLRVAMAEKRPEVAAEVLEGCLSLELTEQDGPALAHALSPVPIEVQQVLHRAFGGGPVEPRSPRAWGLIGSGVYRHDLRYGQFLWETRDKLNEAGRHALAYWLEDLSTATDDWSVRTTKRILAHRKREDLGTVVWGSMGTALINHGRFADATRWLRPFRDRDGVSPWMVENYVLALWERGRPLTATGAAIDALALPADHATNTIAAWALFGCVAEDRPAPPRAELARADGDAATLVHAVRLVRAARAASDAHALEAAVARELDDLETCGHVDIRTGDSFWEVLIKCLELAATDEKVARRLEKQVRRARRRMQKRSGR